MMLRDYFEPAWQQRALGKYGKFARAKGWDIEEKLRLYEASTLAFDPNKPDSKAFGEIYDILRCWQVFRGAVVSTCWSQQEIFDRIRMGFAEFAWGGPIVLPNFARSGKQEVLLSSLVRWKRLNPTSAIQSWLFQSSFMLTIRRCSRSTITR